MKICIESAVLNHHRRSGLMTYTEGLVNGLYANDKRNDYILAYYSLRRTPEQMPGPQSRQFEKKVIRIPDQEFYQRQAILDRFVLPSFLKANKVNVFHRPSGYTMPDLKGIFKVLTVHDLRTLTIKDQVWSQNINNYKKTMNALDMCVVVSECTKQDLLKHFQMDEKKIKVIYLGADHRFTRIDTKVSDAVLKRYQINEPFFLSIGSVPRKNIDNIIRAFAVSKARKDHVLVLGCNMDLDKYQAMVLDLKIEDRVKFLTSLTDNDVTALYNACKAFVFPSLYEGFGLPIVEAMQCGAPVITSNVSSCPEIALDNALIVDPLQPAQIASAMDDLAYNSSLRSALVEKGYARAKYFSWDNFAKGMMDVYALAG